MVIDAFELDCFTVEQVAASIQFNRPETHLMADTLQSAVPILQCEDQIVADRPFGAPLLNVEIAPADELPCGRHGVGNHFPRQKQLST